MKLYGLLMAVGAFCLAGCDEFDAKVLRNPALPPVEVLPSLGGEPIELVKDGKLQFCLVGDFAKESKITGPKRSGKQLKITDWGRDSRRQAVRRLQEAFQATTGESPVFTECDDPAIAKYRYVIVCGKCRYTDELGFDPDKLPHEGFRIQTFAKGVVIAGMDGFEIPGVMDDYNWRCGRMRCNGTEQGAIDFAERFLGIRKYGFADAKDKTLTWDYTPEVKNLVLPPFAYTDYPRQRIRALKTPTRNGCSSGFFGGEFPSPNWLIKMHPDRLEDIFYRDSGGRLWCDAKSYGMNFLDVTNPKLADILVDDFKAYYAKGGDEENWGTTWAPCGEYLWFGQCDKGMILDNARAKAIPPAKGEFKMSEVYGHFYKYFGERCEKEIPGKTVVLMAYSSYLEAPQSVGKLPDNVQIMCCLGSPAFARSPHFQKIWKETFGGWNALTKKKCVPYTYDIGYDEDEVIQQAIRGYFEGEFYRVLDGSIDPSLTYNCMYRGGIPYHYSTYLASRCMWNPDFDVDAALKEYFHLMYGPAAEKLEEFYYGVLDRWINHYLPYEPYPATESRKGSIPCPNKNLWHFTTFEEGACRKLLATLDEAEKLLKPDTLEMKRFTWFATPFRNQLGDIIAFQHMKAPAIVAPKAKGPITPDGALDEADWASSKLPAFHRAYAGGDRPCISPETHVLWNDEGLFVSLKSTDFTVGNALWKGDAFELMLAPVVEGKVSNLYQFVLDPAGFYEDFWKQVDPPRGKEINWRAPNAKHGAKQGDGFWTGELFIPWKDLAPNERPKAGDVWKLNLIYNRKKPFEYISLSPTQNNNHRIDLFATVKFAE